MSVLTVMPSPSALHSSTGVFSPCAWTKVSSSLPGVMNGDQVVMSPKESSSNWASTLNRTSSVSTRTVSGDGVSHIDVID